MKDHNWDDSTPFEATISKAAARKIKFSSKWDDSTPFEAETYVDQPYGQRVKQGLTIDRSSNNSNAYDDMILLEMSDGKMPRDRLSLLSGPLYRLRRKNDWNTKRWANAQMAKQTNADKHMIDLFTPILLDMLSYDPPTARDWKNVSEKNEKQVRRTEEYYQHMISKPNSGIRLILWEKDGSISTYPKRIVRDDVCDSRVAEIATPYSSPTVSDASFDPRVFVDEIYVRRERRFWKNALRVLSRWLEGGGRMRPQKAGWLPYHIVNNDIGLHVLFDNLSVEYESRWLNTLGAKSQAEFCNGNIRIFGEDMYLGGTVPDPYGLDNAKKAVEEHESFLVDFGKEVPENLQHFMIPQDKMSERIRDLIMEAAVELKPQRVEPDRVFDVRRLCSRTASADEWDLVCMALASSSLQSKKLES